jgi:hypothetical protein
MNASREPLRNPNFHSHIQNRLPLITILKEINSVPTQSSYFFKRDFNTILESTLRPCNRSPSFMFLQRKFCKNFYSSPCSPHAPLILTCPFDLINLTIFVKSYKFEHPGCIVVVNLLLLPQLWSTVFFSTLFSKTFGQCSLF